jgi:hypothetical protein
MVYQAAIFQKILKMFLFLHIDGRPHFAKLLFNDVKKVEIAAIDPDF